MQQPKAVRAAHNALVYHGGDPGPRGAYAVAMALYAAEQVGTGEAPESAHRTAIAEAQRRTKLRLSVGGRGR